MYEHVATTSHLKEGIMDLFSFSRESDRQVQNFEIIYDVHQKTAVVKGKLTKIESGTVEIDDTPYSIIYTANRIINSLSVVYSSPYFSKVMITGNTDELGLVTESLQVKCRFKTNLPEYGQTVDEIVKMLLHRTAQGETQNKLIGPLNEISLHFQRKKLRQMDFIFEEDDTASYSGIDDLYIGELTTFIHNYLTYPGSHKPDARVSFDLSTRTRLKTLEVSVIPDIKLNAPDGLFNGLEAKYVLQQVNQMLWLLPDTEIKELTLSQKRPKKGPAQYIYQVAFNLESNEEQTDPQQVGMNDAAGEAFASVLSQIYEHYGIHTDYPHLGLLDLTVKLEAQHTGWYIEYLSAQLTDRNLESTASMNQLFNQVQATLQDSPLAIKDFKLLMRQQRLIKLTCTIAAANDYTNQPAMMNPENTLKVNSNALIERVFRLNQDHNYYLSEENFEQLYD
ncbi:hypothetical protein FOD75_11525 (plasmid) [Limosilactobacillus reuteri]|uniref:Uncharacterized protein n=1 Tax=Limosilactobacillus reuteri TaxID=1598 RepID=A0A517D8M2_LIMRT|nr:hypothetical protein [Limosilactobacillus reuteri]QDR73711.1 hypothetical protein FOD75_11525 [Limosilactobacillus reuteri]